MERAKQGGRIEAAKINHKIRAWEQKAREQSKLAWLSSSATNSAFKLRWKNSDTGKEGTITINKAFINAEEIFRKLESMLASKAALRKDAVADTSEDENEHSD
jgi:hypothetical protein